MENNIEEKLGNGFSRVPFASVVVSLVYQSHCSTNNIFSSNLAGIFFSKRPQFLHLKKKNWKQTRPPSFPLICPVLWTSITLSRNMFRFKLILHNLFRQSSCSLPCFLSWYSIYNSIVCWGSWYAFFMLAESWRI